MVIEVNKSYKNESPIGKCQAIIENSKLGKQSYLIEYSCQAQGLDAPRYPKTVGQGPYLLTINRNPNLKLNKSNAKSSQKRANGSSIRNPKKSLKETPGPCIHPLLCFVFDITHIIFTSLHNIPMMPHMTTYIAMSLCDALMMSFPFFMKPMHLHTCIRVAVPYTECVH